MRSRYLSTTLFAIFIAIIIVVPVSDIFAQETAIENPIKSEKLEEILERIARVLMAVAIPVFGVMVAVGSYYIVTGADNPQNRQKARKIFSYSTLGFLIIMFSAGIIQLIKIIF